ncbi:MAG: hypothetical protein AB7H97_02495 [Pseudobdellovibrionaceae bacterium]
MKQHLYYVIQFFQALILLLPFATAVNAEPLVKLGKFGLWQESCSNKRGCETWVQYGEAKVKISGIEGQIGKLSKNTDGFALRGRIQEAIIESKSFSWCPDFVCKSEGGSWLTLDLVELDPNTQGLLVTTTEGFETTYNHWIFFVPSGKNLKPALEGNTGLHGASILGNWGFTRDGKSVGYGYLQFSWAYGDKAPDQESLDQMSSLFRFEEKRWNSDKKTFVSPSKDPIHVWSLILGSGKDFGKLQKEVQNIEKALEACGDSKNRFSWIYGKPFKKLTPEIWLYGEMSLQKTALEKIQDDLGKCAPSLKPMLKEAH